MRKLLLAATLSAAAVGCGGGDEKKVQSQREAIDGTLSSFTDQISNPKTAGVWFANGKAPDEKGLKTYQNKSYQTGDEPKVEGTTATVPVKVHDEESGKDMGPFTWTFAKDGEKWKIESAPLQ